MNLSKLTEEFDVRSYLHSQNVCYLEEGKNIGMGSIGICCPSCGDDGFHIGILTDTKLFNCWRCDEGGNLVGLIMLLEGVSSVEALNRIQNSSEPVDRTDFADKIKEVLTLEEPEIVQEKPKRLTLPCSVDLKSLRDNIRSEASFLDFIVSRNYKVEDLSDWDIQACFFGDFCNRLMFPVYYKKQLVNYFARAVTHATTKYKNCMNDRAIIHTRKLLYGYDFVEEGQEKLVICEGAFDTIRFGKGVAIAILGKSMTVEQIEMLCSLEITGTIYIALDGDAFAAAHKLALELQPLVGCYVEVLILERGKDPDNYLTQQLLEKTQ